MNLPLRRLAVGALLLALAACRPDPTAPPPPATASPVPTSTNFTDPIRLAWFYRPPVDEALPILAEYFDFFILTKSDEPVRDQLKSAGVSAPFLEYLRFDAIHDPGDCQARPRRNQVAYEAGDFCRIDAEHADWFLLDAAGRRIRVNDDYFIMDPGHPGWRAFWRVRAQAAQETLGWDGVFMDNVDATAQRWRELAPPAYPSEALYEAAVLGFVEEVYANYAQPTGRPLFANIIAAEAADDWLPFLPYLDGVMDEAWAMDWAAGYLPVAEWEAHLARAEAVQAAGKTIVLVAQGAQAASARQQFAFASYLLISHGRAVFRYIDSDHYREVWWYANYDLDLGAPLGPRYPDGSGWRRDFEHGTVRVDPATQAVTLTVP